MCRRRRLLQHLIRTFLIVVSTEAIEAWRNRPFEGYHPYVCLDGIVLKRTWAGEVRNVSLLVAIGVNAEGYREILGIVERILTLPEASLLLSQRRCGRLGRLCLQCTAHTLVTAVVLRARWRDVARIDTELEPPYRQSREPTGTRRPEWRSIVGSNCLGQANVVKNAL